MKDAARVWAAFALLVIGGVSARGGSSRRGPGPFRRPPPPEHDHHNGHHHHHGRHYDRPFGQDVPDWLVEREAEVRSQVEAAAEVAKDACRGEDPQDFALDFSSPSSNSAMVKKGRKPHGEADSGNSRQSRAPPSPHGHGSHHYRHRNGEGDLLFEFKPVSFVLHHEATEERTVEEEEDDDDNNTGMSSVLEGETSHPSLSRPEEPIFAYVDYAVGIDDPSGSTTPDCASALSSLVDLNSELESIRQLRWSYEHGEDGNFNWDEHPPPGPAFCPFIVASVTLLVSSILASRLSRKRALVHRIHRYWRGIYLNRGLRSAFEAEVGESLPAPPEHAPDMANFLGLCLARIFQIISAAYIFVLFASTVTMGVMSFLMDKCNSDPNCSTPSGTSSSSSSSSSSGGSSSASDFPLVYDFRPGVIAAWWGIMFALGLAFAAYSFFRQRSSSDNSYPAAEAARPRFQIRRRSPLSEVYVYEPLTGTLSASAPHPDTPTGDGSYSPPTAV